MQVIAGAHHACEQGTFIIRFCLTDTNPRFSPGALTDAQAGWNTCPTARQRRYEIALAFRLPGRYADLRGHSGALRNPASTGAIMTIHVIRNVFFAASIFAAMPLAADPVADPQAGPPADEASGEALAREVQTLIDAILQHHIDPPTRQELWLAGARAVVTMVGVGPYPVLSADVSGLSNSSDFAQFAKRLWLNESIQKQEKSVEAFRQNFIDGVLAAVPGGAQLIARKDLAVQEQLAGNRYVGTGIALSFDVEKKYPRIETVIPGGPMERAGGRSGDWMLKIDDRDTHGLELVKIIDLLRGEEGTGVALVVRDATGASRTITVTRGPVVLETIEGLRKGDARGPWDFRVDADSPIRYLKIVQINGSTVHDLMKLETEFRRSGATAVILDLRAARGGELHHAMLLADALLDGGLIGRVRTQGDVQEFRADRERIFRDWPVVLLVDGQTGGVAEWIAAAVQDNRAGKVVGEDTAGIWQVSSAIQLSGMNSALLLRTGTFERPKKDYEHRRLNRIPRIVGGAPVVGIPGVTPDRQPPGDFAPATGPFAVLRKPVPPVPTPPERQEDDAILKLAVEELKRTVS